jgi:hypothetical protein
MNRPQALGFSEKEVTIDNANGDASILDEDAWEDATDESGFDCEMLCYSRWRSSTFDSVD